MVRFLAVLCLGVCGFAFSADLTAKSWAVSDGNGEIIQGSGIGAIRSIASITKLMTVIVVLDSRQDLNQKIGRFTREQHIQLALVKSDNASANLLCRKYVGGTPACVRAMNEKARYLGMIDTRYVEASGVSPNNVSTVIDLIKIVRAAKQYTPIVTASNTSFGSIKVKKRVFVYKNTNPIIQSRHDFLVSKTGTTHAAGGCLVMMLDTAIGERIIVILGSRNGKTRIPEARQIIENIPD
jgi:D-alanyl-D-alanine endopeptidase (penicillin-binding protein 7)